MKLITENRQGSGNEESINADPNFNSLNVALNELNGEFHSLLTVELASGVVLHIGGGPNEYMSQILNGDTCMLAIGSLKKVGMTELIVGGQSSEFESRVILSYEQARDILLVFYHGDGVHTTTVAWELR